MRHILDILVPYFLYMKISKNLEVDFWYFALIAFRMLWYESLICSILYAFPDQATDVLTKRLLCCWLSCFEMSEVIENISNILNNGNAFEYFALNTHFQKLILQLLIMEQNSDLYIDWELWPQPKKKYYSYQIMSRCIQVMMKLLFLLLF